MLKTMWRLVVKHGTDLLVKDPVNIEQLFAKDVIFSNFID